MLHEDIKGVRGWTESAAFKAQCEAHQMSPWSQRFMQGAIHSRLDGIALHSGVHPDITPGRARAVIDALAAAGQALARGEYDPTTQQRVHEAYAAYAAAAELYNSDRESPQNALVRHHRAPSDMQRSAAWHAANAAMPPGYR